MVPIAQDTTSASSRFASAPLWALAALVGALPVLTGNLTGLGLGRFPLLYDAVALPRLALAAVVVLVAAALWAWDARREGRVRTHLAVWLLAAVGALAVVSTVFSVDPLMSVLGQSERLEGTLTWVLYALAFFVGLQAVRSPAALRVLLWALAAGAGICGLLGLAQNAGLDPTSYLVEAPLFDKHRAFATFGNPNFLAGLFVLALAPSAALAMSTRGWRSATAWVLTATIALALFATFTRGAWFAAAVSMVAFAVAARVAGYRVGRRDGLAIGALAGGLALLAAVSTLRAGEANVISRFVVGGQGGESVRERLLTVQAAVASVAARPLLGWGPDSFLAAFRANRPDAYASAFGAAATVNNAHDWPLQAAVTLGLPAGVLFVAAVVLALRDGLRAARSAGEGPQALLFAGAWAGCVGFAVHMLANVAALGATIPFFVLLAAVCAPAARTREASGPSMRVLSAGLALLGVAAVVTFGSVVVADGYYLRSRLAYRGAADGDAAAYARRAMALNPLSPKYSRGFAQALDGLPEARGAWTLHLSRHPRDYAGLAWAAAAAARGGDGARAKELARRAGQFDRQAVQVAALRRGRTDADSIGIAQSVPALP
jgi:O-antigen ligase